MLMHFSNHYLSLDGASNFESIYCQIKKKRERHTYKLTYRLEDSVTGGTRVITSIKANIR